MQMEYELMVILKPLLPEDLRSGVQKRIEDLVKKLKGEIKDTDVWGKRHLAYPIGKQDEGYYVVYKVVLEQEKVDKFKTELKLEGDIIRFLLSKLEK